MEDFLEDLDCLIAELDSVVASFLHRIRKRRPEESLLGLICNQAQARSIPLAVGVVPPDALLLKILAMVLDANAAMIVFDMVYHAEPVNVAYFEWASSMFMAQCGKSACDFTEKNTKGRIMKSYEGRDPLNLTELPETFNRRWEYMMELDSQGDIFLHVGVLFAFEEKGKLYHGVLSNRIDFMYEDIDLVMDYILNDDEEHLFDLSDDFYQANLK